MTTKMIAYCGLVCSDCEAYVATQANDQDALVRVRDHWRQEYDAPAMSVDARERTLSVETLVALEADLLTVKAHNPLPPGSRVRIARTLPNDDRELVLTGKIVAIDRDPAGDVTMKVRLHSLPRAERSLLEDALSERAPGFDRATRGD